MKQQQRAELVDTYWLLMRSGETNASACRVLGMSRRSGTTIRRAHHYQTRVRAPRVVWSGRYLDIRERLQIADLLRLGCSARRIAAELGRQLSTIKRELDRHRSPEGRYLPRTADHGRTAATSPIAGRQAHCQHQAAAVGAAQAEPVLVTR
jgi:IS30 family transposase